MHFNCEKCGDSRKALLNGYRFGDIQLEGVWFEVSLVKGSDQVTDFQPTQDSIPFLAKMGLEGREQVLADGKEVAQNLINEDDFFTCTVCRSDVIVEED